MKKKSKTEKELVEVLKRLDRCENMAQVCFVFDSLSSRVKRLLRCTEDELP